METQTEPPSRPVRVRVAPSPTGDPHVGTAYIALFNFVFARSQGGQCILRIEDTDRVRSRESSERAILDALKWVGLSWDEGPDVGGDCGPYRQSERSSIYREHATMLIERGRAYRCFCTPERITQVREQQRAEGRKTLGYDRNCRGLSPAESKQRVDAGETHTVRLAMPIGGVTTFHDRLRGKVEIANEQVDDQILLKSDGFPTYHLANVVDDRLMKISHVIRGEEWISSTPKHVVLYDAFGWPEPEWIHMPLLRNEKKAKLSKRRDPVSIHYYRDTGFLPQALLNFLGIMGWSFGGDREKFNLGEMIAKFSWDRISLGGPVFDHNKLRWLNEQYVHELSYAELAAELEKWRFGQDYLLRVLPLVRERIKQFDEFVATTSFFFCGDIDLTAVVEKIKIPDVPSKDVRKGLLALIEKYEALPEWEAALLETASREFAESLDWKTKHLFMVLRYLVTGRKASPPLFETMEVIGKELVRRRLRNGAVALVGKKG